MKLISFKNKVQAFTLVELLVVLGLFSGIATIALGSLANVQTINSHLQQNQSVLDNVNLSTQIVMRDVRFGSEFYCAISLPTLSLPIPRTRNSCIQGGIYNSGNGGSVLIFEPADAATSTDRVAYYLLQGVLYKNEYYSGATNTLQITSNDVTITSLRFYVNGAQSSDGLSDEGSAFDYQQPLITMLVSGIATAELNTRKASSSAFSLETTVSARSLDNK